MLDVCAVAYVLLGREPARTLDLYGQDLGLPPKAARRWVAALVGLHDIGKATPVFQSDWRPGMEVDIAAGFVFGASYPNVKHGLLSQKILIEVLVGIGFDAVVANVVADALGAHHGYRFDAAQLRRVIKSDLGEGLWTTARLELVSTYFAAIGLCLTEYPSVTTFFGQAHVRLAGLTTFSDWIGSTEDHFPTDRLVADPAQYYRDSLRRAEAALDGIGWNRRAPLTPANPSFEQLFPTLEPNALQRAMIEVVKEIVSPSLIIVEAPMGRGKTEAAFYAHAVLQSRLGHRGMYVALPSQATGNAMFERTRAFLASADRKEAPDLQLLHGASLLNDSYAKIQVSGVNGVTNTSENVWARSWFTSNKRGMLSEYGVGTVDQALLGIMNIKHQPLRLWGLGNRTVVIDEVHAYGLYTTKLIELLVEWLGAMDSTVILLSATLTAAQRRRLVQRYGGLGEPDAVPYPRISTVTRGVVQVRGFAAGVAQKVNLKNAPLAISELTPLVQGLVEQGGCVAAILNTVQRAQDLYEAMGPGEVIDGGKRLSDGSEVYLFHARYPADERQAREAGVLRRFGIHGARPERAILIATQVIEQSLDLDFDVMVTDLAPIDLIIQRIGRLHRHARPVRPQAHSKPVVFIAGLTAADELPDLTSAYFDKVYEAHALYLTWLTLAGRETVTIPSEIELLVEQVYGDNPVQATEDGNREVIAKALAAKQSGDFNQSRTAISPLVSIRAPRVFTTPDGLGPTVLRGDNHDPEVSEQLRVSTRLGREGIVVIPLFRFGRELYLEPEKVTRVSLDEEPSWSLAKQMYLRHVKLSRWEIVNEYRANGPTAAWSKNPLLRYALPLVLEERVAQVGALRVGLDGELGVTYNRDS